MLYGVETAQPGHGAPGAPSGPYVASAVTFSSASLVLSSLACTDNQYFGFAGWFKADYPGHGPMVGFIVDPLGNYDSNFFGRASGFLTFAITNNIDSKELTVQSSAAPDTAWHHVICAGQTNFAAGSKVIKMKIDGVDRTGSVNDSATSFNFGANGVPFWVGSDNSFFWNGSMADLSIWAGINLLTAGDISSTTIQLFRTTGGAPVDPHVAIAALGHPPIFLSGDASTFRLNTLGTSGAFTLTAGTLTNAATHP